MILRLFIISIIFFTGFGKLNSQVQFYSSVENKNVAFGERFEVKFTAENASIEKIKLPEFSNFAIVSGPNKSQEYSNINGKVSQKEQIGLVLEPIKKGVFTIGSASLSIGKKIYNTAPLTINVTNGSKLKQTTNTKNNDLFIETEVSTTTAYPMQQIIVKYKLYNAVLVENVQPYQLAEMNDFTAKEIKETFSQQNFTSGKSNYEVNTIMAFALYPKKTGTFTIGSSVFDAVVSSGSSGNIFDDGLKTVHITTKPFTIKVKDLPPTPKNDFSGIVGNYKILATVNDVIQKQGEAFPLTINIETNSQPEMVKAPKIMKFMPDFEVYEPKLVSSNTTFSEGEEKLVNVFEYLIVPKVSGIKNIKIYSTFFNPTTGKYETAHAPEISLKIEKGNNIKNLNTNNNGGQDAIMTSLKLTKIKDPYYMMNIFYVSIILFIIALMVLLVVTYTKRSNINLLRRLKNKDLVFEDSKARINNALSLANNADNDTYFKDISDALNKYLSEKLNIDIVDLSKDSISQKLGINNIDENIIDKLNSIIEVCETHLYSGIQASKSTGLITDALEVLEKIQSTLKNKKII